MKSTLTPHKSTMSRENMKETLLEDQERLVEIMNDSPRICSFDGTDWEVRALKPGTQWLIAQEAIAIQKKEDASFGDIIRSFAESLPAVAKVITLCLLNDRRRIYADGHSGELSEEFYSTYETILWDTDQKHWIALLVEVMKMLDMECFFAATSSIRTLRRRTLERKTTEQERRP